MTFFGCSGRWLPTTQCILYRVSQKSSWEKSKWGVVNLLLPPPPVQFEIIWNGRPVLILISIRNFFWNTLYVTLEERTGNNSSTSWFKCWQVYCLCQIWCSCYCSCCMIYTNINIICILLSPYWWIIKIKLRFSLQLPLNLPEHQEQRKSGGPDWWQSTRRWRSQHLTRWSPTSPPADNHSDVVGRLFDFVQIFEDSIVRMIDLF